MSTLKVATIQDTSGNNSSTPAQIAEGTATAWVNFNGTGTVAIRDSFNVSSITDGGTGIYTVNFTTNFSDISYAAFVNTSNWTGSANYGTTSPAVSSIGVRTRSSTTFTDYDHVYIAVFGD